VELACNNTYRIQHPCSLGRMLALIVKKGKSQHIRLVAVVTVPSKEKEAHPGLFLQPFQHAYMPRPFVTMFSVEAASSPFWHRTSQTAPILSVYLPPAGSVPPAKHFAFGLQGVVGAAVYVATAAGADELELEVEAAADEVELEVDEVEAAADELELEVEAAADELELEDDVELEAVDLEDDVELEAVELEAVELETTTLLAKLEFGALVSALGFAAVRK
jgi:hypothetical protein